MVGWPLSPLVLPGPKDDNICENGVPWFDANRKQWMFFDLMTAVEYAKTFDFFHCLDKKDRKILLKHAAVSCMNLHVSHFTVSSKFDNLVNPDGTLMPFISWVWKLMKKWKNKKVPVESLVIPGVWWLVLLSDAVSLEQSTSYWRSSACAIQVSHC